MIRLAILAGMLMTGTVAPSGAAAGQSFDYCQNGAQASCVVDGDTFRWQGDRVRILNIDAPETHSPKCAEKAVLGFRAGDRLIELLNAGEWRLDRDPDEPRDADRYGRLLRLLVVGGKDAGELLVSDGLARPWRVKREAWCNP